ncbi:hypothetical protein ACHAWU_009955 [Discostella pseudostelligera]|uniref:Uncharacterized protein n=1 Tax=Discostella pseudostelligera TaxID=259834 RepID=A0ABD3M3C1_9STRA
MFSYVAKSLLNKTLRAFLRKYLENIELDSIDYGSSIAAGNKAAENSNRDGASSSSSGWGVRLSNVKLREGMELVKLPGKHKRAITRKKRVKKNRDRCTNYSDYVTTPVAKNTSTGIAQFEDRGGVLLNSPFDVDGSDTSLYGEHRRDSDNGYCSSTSTSPIQSNRFLCRLPSNCRSAPTREAAKGHDDIESNDILANDSDSLTQETESYSNFIPTNCKESMHNNNNVEGEDDDSYTEIDEEIVIEEDLALVVGAGGSIGTLHIRYIGKDLHVTIEDAHLIVEAVPTNDLNRKEDTDTSKSPRPKMKRDQSSSAVSDTDLAPETTTTEQKISTIGEKIEKKSMVAKYLSLIPHLFLRDCRLTLIFPEEIGSDEYANDSCDDCTILEFGIDFLSVTSGDDFLDVLRFDTGSHAFETPSQKPQPNSNSGASSQRPQVNIFSRKRIRTGKGPDGGVWMKIQPPIRRNTPYHRNRQHNGPPWARERFLDASESFFFRCSGIDFQARMLVDREDLVHDVSNAWSNEYDDYTMDSMLFGVDYVDPMSLARHQIKKNMKKEQNFKSVPIDLVSDVDSNGIQSIPYASNCHWIAQRVHRKQCESSHLPLNECYLCWSECVREKSKASSPSGNQTRKRNMNNMMPLPGFVFCLSISDPLELNVDLCSLQSIGYINSLFMSKNQQPCEEQGNFQSTSDGTARKKPCVPNATIASSNFDENSFPSFMQPHAIYMSSLSVSNLIIRVEAIRRNVSNKWNVRYWQFLGQSIHYEESQIDAEEQYLRDVMFHVGRMECKDFTGVCEKTLFAIAGSECKNSASEVPLPCTAARIIGVSQLLPNDERTTSAVHLRLIQSDFPGSDAGEKSVLTARVGFVDLRMGVTDIDVDDKLIGDISGAINQATSILFPGPNASKAGNVEMSDKDSKGALNWLCHVSMEGGSFIYAPKVKMVIPESTFRLRMGPEGPSLESLLHGLSIEYGSYSFEKPTIPSIIPFCSLPETLRMHILLYIDELSPLEEVLNIKKKKSSLFLRSHALSKSLAMLPQSSLVTNKHRSISGISRRNLLLNRLQSLETESLEALLVLHTRSCKK